MLTQKDEIKKRYGGRILLIRLLDLYPGVKATSDHPAFFCVATNVLFAYLSTGFLLSQLGTKVSRNTTVRSCQLYLNKVLNGVRVFTGMPHEVCTMDRFLPTHGLGCVI